MMQEYLTIEEDENLSPNIAQEKSSADSKASRKRSFWSMNKVDVSAPKEKKTDSRPVLENLTTSPLVLATIFHQKKASKQVYVQEEVQLLEKEITALVSSLREKQRQGVPAKDLFPQTSKLIEMKEKYRGLTGKWYTTNGWQEIA